MPKIPDLSRSRAAVMITAQHVDGADAHAVRAVRVTSSPSCSEAYNQLMDAILQLTDLPVGEIKILPPDNSPASFVLVPQRLPADVRNTDDISYRRSAQSVAGMAVRSAWNNGAGIMLRRSTGWLDLIFEVQTIAAGGEDHVLVAEQRANEQSADDDVVPQTTASTRMAQSSALRTEFSL